MITVSVVLEVILKNLCVTLNEGEATEESPEPRFLDPSLRSGGHLGMGSRNRLTTAYSTES